jgi:hypothetical protein
MTDGNELAIRNTHLGLKLIEARIECLPKRQTDESFNEYKQSFRKFQN